METKKKLGDAMGGGGFEKECVDVRLPTRVCVRYNGEGIISKHSIQKELKTIDKNKA